MSIKGNNPRVVITNEFRFFLIQNLEEKRKRNSSYSLRAFANHLGVHHTFLSRILSGARSISKNTQQKFLRVLQLTPQEVDKYFLQKPTPWADVKLEQLELDTFVMVSDWFHDAILELTRLKYFKPDFKWIAKILGISESAVKKAVDRLVRLNLLAIDEDGVWRDLSGHNTNIIDSDFTNQALRNYQKQVLELATKAVDRYPKAKRDNTSIMMVINSKDLPKAKKRIQKFRREMAVFLNRAGKNADQLYQLGIAFFPIAEV